MCIPKELGEMPIAFIVLAKVLRSLGSAMMTLPIWAPAMLKVLVVAVIITSRSVDVGAASGIGGVFLAGIDEVMVDLVRHEDEVVALAEIGHLAQFIHRPDPPAGVVRRAEDQHLLAPGQLASQAWMSSRAVAVLQWQRAFQNLAPAALMMRAKAW
jgi:hypothetical protein